MKPADLAAFKRSFGEPGEAERRTVPLARSSKVTSTGDGKRLKVLGHASVFGSPSIEMRSPYGSFTEYIDRHAFDKVLARNPNVVLTWDHDTRYPLATTGAGTLELRANDHGLRYWATCSRTSYAEDLAQLMEDGVVTQSSFLFSIAKDGEDWRTVGDKVYRTVTEVGELYDVCVTVAGMYPATDSGIARKLMLDYATSHGLLRVDPEATARAARLRVELELRRRLLTSLDSPGTRRD